MTVVCRPRKNKPMDEWIKGGGERLTILLVSSALLLSACATASSGGYVDVSAWGANYTEDFIYDFSVQTVSGKDTGVAGSRLSEFSRGGTGGRECCSLMPGVGQTIKIVWQVGGRQDDRSKWKTYSRDTVVKGTMPGNPGQTPHSVLIVRFFPSQEVEAELFPGNDSFGPANPRVDKLFSIGPKVMRYRGE
jgi:hypothetical protein